MKDHADCVTWVSATVRVEVSRRRQKHAFAGAKLEALGTIIAEDGLTVLSFESSRPHGYLAFAIRTPGGSVNANYTEVLSSYAGWYGSTRQVVAQGHRLGLGLRFANQGKNKT